WQRSRCSGVSWPKAARAAGSRTSLAPRTHRPARAECGAIRFRQGTRGGIRPPRHDARRTARTQRPAALQSQDARAAAPAVRKQRGLLSLALKILRQQVLATSENRIPIHAARKVHGFERPRRDEPVETMPKLRRYGKTAALEDYAGMAAGFGLHR